MSGEDLAKVFEEVVLKVLDDNPVRFVALLEKALDWSQDNGVELANQIQSKMKLPPTPPPVPVASSLAEVQLNADTRVTQLVTDLKNCLVGTRVKLANQVAESGELATESWVTDEIQEKTVDEDQVRDLINGAWNGA